MSDKSRLAITYLRNDVASISCESEVIDTWLGCRIERGDTLFFVAYGYEWEGECTRVHHLFGQLIEHGNNHLPMFRITAQAVRKIPT